MPKGSDGRYIHVGLVGPKPRPRGVGDGQTVDIPLPLRDDKVCTEDGARYACRRAGEAAAKRAGRKPEAWGRRRDTKANQVDPHFLEKPHAGSRERPYRKPTQVGGCESTKVDG